MVRLNVEIECDLSERETLKELDENIRKIAEEVLVMAKRNLILAKKYVFGWLYMSGEVKKIFDGCHEVQFLCDYASVVEFGRRAGSRMPPREPVLMWLMAKFNMTLDEASKREYAVRLKIAKEGIEPYPFLRMAVNEVMGDSVFTCEESWEEFEGSDISGDT